MHEREVLYATVVRALEEIKPLHHYLAELQETLLWRQVRKIFDRIPNGPCNWPKLPMAVQGTSPTGFEFASGGLQEEETAKARQRCRHAVAQPISWLFVSTLRLSYAVRSGTQTM